MAALPNMSLNRDDSSTETGISVVHIKLNVRTFKQGDRHIVNRVRIQCSRASRWVPADRMAAARSLRRPMPITLYSRIAEELTRRIADGIYPVGTPMPGENALVE